MRTEKFIKRNRFAGNVHDSQMFHEVYDNLGEIKENTQAVAVDAGYKTPCIMIEIIKDGKMSQNMTTVVTRHIWAEYMEQAEEYCYVPKYKKSTKNEKKR